MMQFFISPTFWKTVLASTTPVMLATLAANMMTKSGIFNLAIEGTMLICALTGVVASAFTQNLWVGCITAVLMGVAISFVFGYFALIMKGAMNACGVALNLVATGGTVFVLVMLTGSKANSSALKSLTFPVVNIPVLQNIPVIGTILSGHNLVTYIAWVIVAVTSWMLYKTKLGINIRAVGENPAAAKAAGLNVIFHQFVALAICGSTEILYDGDGCRKRVYVAGDGCHEPGKSGDRVSEFTAVRVFGYDYGLSAALQ